MDMVLIIMKKNIEGVLNSWCLSIRLQILVYQKRPTTICPRLASKAHMVMLIPNMSPQASLLSKVMYTVLGYFCLS